MAFKLDDLLGEIEQEGVTTAKVAVSPRRAPGRSAPAPDALPAFNLDELVGEIEAEGPAPPSPAPAAPRAAPSPGLGRVDPTLDPNLGAGELSLAMQPPPEPGPTAREQSVADVVRPPATRMRVPGITAETRPLPGRGLVSAWRRGLGMDPAEPTTAPADIARAQIELEARANRETPEAYVERVSGQPATIPGRAHKGFTRGVLGVGENLGQFGRLAGDVTGSAILSNTALEFEQAFGNTAAQYKVANPNFFDHLAEGAGSMAAFLIPAGGQAALIATLPPRAARVAMAVSAAATEAAAESGQVYATLTAQGMDQAEAAKRAGAAFAANGALLTVTNKLGLFSEPGQAGWAQIKRHLKTAALEGPGQEGPQEIIQALATNQPIDPAAVAQASAIGAIVGGGASVATSRLGQRPAPGRPAPQEPPAPGEPPVDARLTVPAGEAPRTPGPPMPVPPGPLVQQAEATLGPGAAPEAVEAEINRLLGIPEGATPPGEADFTPGVQPVSPVPQAAPPASLVIPPSPEVVDTGEDLGFTPGVPVLPPQPAPSVAETALGPQVEPPPVVPPRRRAPGRVPRSTIPEAAPQVPEPIAPPDQAAAYGATLDLTDPDSVSAFVRAHGGIKADPARKGEMAAIPLDLKNNKTGAAWDVIAQQAEAQGVQGLDLLNALTDLGSQRRQKRERVIAEQRALDAQAQLEALPIEAKAEHIAALSGQDVEVVAAELRADQEEQAALDEALDFFAQAARQEEGAPDAGRQPEGDLSRAPAGPAAGAPAAGVGEGAPRPGPGRGREAERALPVSPPPAPEGPAAAAGPEGGARRAPGRRPRVDQARIPGTAESAVPATPTRAATPQADLTETPLFGQERAAREEAMAAAQGDLKPAPDVTPRWLQKNILTETYMAAQKSPESFQRYLAKTPDAVRDLQEQGVTPEDVSRVMQPRAAPARGKLAAAPATTEAAPEPHKFSSTQINLPGEIAEDMRNWAEGTLPKSDLAADGIEQAPHVTVKYGLHTTDPAEVAKVLADHRPLDFTLGTMDVFSNDEHDVLYVKIEKAPSLHGLNRAISEDLETTDANPRYIPHATIAYLKPGEGKRYVGSRAFEGRQIIASEIVFTPTEGERSTLPLAAAPTPRPAPARKGKLIPQRTEEGGVAWTTVPVVEQEPAAESPLPVTEVGREQWLDAIDEAEGREPPATPPKAEPAVMPTGQYEHAPRLRKMVAIFDHLIQKDDLPKDGRALRKVMAQRTLIDEKTLGTDAAAIDDMFDALEAAVNLDYKRFRDSGHTLDQQLERAVKAEAWMVNRLKTIEVRQRQQFSTPLPLAEGAAYALDVKPGETVGEPTAGTGNLLAPLPPEVAIQAVEMDPRRVEALRAQGYHVEPGDALRTPLEASVVVMNPPWGKYSTQKYGKAIPMPYGGAVDLAERFVVKVLRELPAGGRVSAVMPTTILQSAGFLNWLQTAHTLRALIVSPPDAYNSRGTTVDSVLLVVDKGVVPDAPSPIRPGPDNPSPATWPEYAEALRPLAAGGSHARVGQGPVQPGPVGARGRPAGVVSVGRPAGGPEGQPAGGTEPAADPAGAGAVAEGAPADAVDRGPGVGGPPAGAQAVEPGRGAPGRRQSGAGVVPGPGRGGDAAQPVGAGESLRPAARGAAAYPVREGGQRFSVASQAELDAAQRSDVFAAAPLRSAPGANPHPRLIVRTKSLSGAELPALTYEPKGKLLADAYRRKVISDAQWDGGIIPALQAGHKGHGFLFAADVGVGKSRAAAAVAGEWLETGDAHRILYTTAGEVNVQDLRREFDLYAGGTWPYEIIEVSKLKDSSERGKRDTVEPLPARDKAIYIIDRYNLAAYRRALEEVGLDAIIGDEAHLLKNIDGSAAGEAWILLQKQVMARNGKFLYLTATPASSIDDLEHFIGLKEWQADGFPDWILRVTGQAPEAKAGAETLRSLFSAVRDQYLAMGQGDKGEKQAFLDALPEPAGRGKSTDEPRDAYQKAIEALRAEINTLGAQDVTVGSDAEAVTGFKKKKAFLRGTDAFAVHVTPAEQEQIMRELATKGKYDSIDLWRAGVEFEIATTRLTPEQMKEYGRIGTFFRDLNEEFFKWGRLNKSTGKLLTIRHFLQQEAKRRMFDYRLGPAIDAAKAARGRGEQVVISTISVNPTDETSGPIPAAINSINTRAVEVDKETREVITDEEIPEALIARAELLERWMRIRQMGSPIEQITAAFGKDRVAVITGAQSPRVREKVIKEFQQGDRPVAIISGAGKTGISLHHILKAGKGAQGRRHLIVTDYEWSATTFKQELGRVDRSGQISAPKVTVLSTGAAGERKFLATIANRMRNLGALSKGSAESASNDSLAEFEIGGTMDTYAMRLAYNTLSPEIQDYFIAKPFKDPNDAGRAREEGRPQRNLRQMPQAAQLKDFLLDLQFMPIDAADTAFDAFWRTRKEMVAEQTAQGEIKTERTRAYRGEIVRSTELAPHLTLREVKDETGQRFGILQGLVTDHMTRLVRFLPTQGGYSETPIRRYVSFTAGEQQVAGLEIRQGAIKGLSQLFGQSLGEDIRTPEQALEALRAGDKIPLEGATGYTLRMRPSDARIVIEGARMADRDLLQRHGARYSPAGNLWVVPEETLPQFLERFPVKQATQKGGPEPPEPEAGPTFGLFMGLPNLPGTRNRQAWSPPAGTGLEEIEAMNRPVEPARSVGDRFRAAKQRVIETQVNKFEPLRPLMDLVEALQGPTRTGLPRGQVLSEQMRRTGTVPLEVAELAKSRTNGQIQSFAIRFGRVWRAAHDAGVEKALNAYLTLTQMDKRIRDLAGRPPAPIPGQLPGAPMGQVSAAGYRTIQGAPIPTLVNPRGFDKAKIDRELQRLEQDLGPDRWDAVERAGEDLWRLNREILDKSHAAGIVSDEAHQAITALGDDYVPFHVLDYINAHEPQGGATKPYSVRYQDYLRSMAGTERDVANVVEASLQKGVRAIALINRNRAAHAVTRLAGILPGTIDAIPGDTFTLPEQREVVSTFEDGERKNYAVPPEVFRALTFLDEKELGYIERFLGAGATPLRAGATGANTAFMITNLARDLKAAAIYSKYGIQNPVDLARFPLDWVRALASVYRQDNAYLEFLESGAAFTTFQKATTPEGFLQRSARLSPARTDVEEGRYAQATLLAGPRLLRYLFEGAQRLNNLVEEATKKATFERGRRQGDPTEVAAYEAANYGGSPNFARSGSIARELNLVWMFYNARLQGTARTVRRFTEDPSVAAKATAVRLGLMVALPATLLWLWNQGFDDDHGLEEIPASERQRYHVILLHDTYQAADGTTKRKYLKIAKEEGEQILTPLIENGLAWLKGREPQGLTEMALDLAGNVSPVGFDVQEPTPGGIGRALTSGALAGANPVIRIPAEVGSNYNARLQGAIVPRGLADNVLPAQQVRPTTSPTMIQVASVLGVSPIKLEYAVVSATGGVGRSVLDTIDMAQGKTQPDTLSDYERAARQPVISRFLGTQGGAQDRKAEEALYQIADEAKRTKGSMKAVTRTGDEAGVEALTEDRPLVLQALSGRLQGLTRGLAEVRQLSVYTTHHLDADAETKKEILAVLADRRHLILEAFRALRDATDDFTLSGGAVAEEDPEPVATE